MKLTMTEEAVASLRPMKCEIGLLTQPDGSASLIQGDTTTLCAVYGPTQIRASKENIGRATIDVLYKAKSGLPTCADKYFQLLIRKCCESAIVSSMHPRTAINVIIQEVQNSGSLQSAAVNSAFLALLDASVPLQFMLAAVECIIDEDDQIKLNPNTKQENTARAAFTFAFDSVEKNVIGSRTNGTFSQEEYMNCLQLCREASDHVFSFYRESLEKKVKRSTDV